MLTVREFQALVTTFSHAVDAHITRPVTSMHSNMVGYTPIGLERHYVGNENKNACYPDGTNLLPPGEREPDMMWIRPSVQYLEQKRLEAKRRKILEELDWKKLTEQLALYYIEANKYFHKQVQECEHFQHKNISNEFIDYLTLTKEEDMELLDSEEEVEDEFAIRMFPNDEPNEEGLSFYLIFAKEEFQDLLAGHEAFVRLRLGKPREISEVTED